MKWTPIFRPPLKVPRRKVKVPRRKVKVQAQVLPSATHLVRASFRCPESGHPG
jgi:hypothetical protein